MILATVFLIFLQLFQLVYSDEVLGCGGYIKSHVPIDFSKIEVKLVTKQGIIKDKTNCAPNGYYFVPLYDKGELILELSPPAGWSFTPGQVVLNIDGSDDCSQGKDINFVFKGFGITGKVYSLGSDEKGPKGVIVNLISKEGTRTTYSDENGDFFFTPVFPGMYTINIAHPKWRIFKKSIDIKVNEGNAEIPAKNLVVEGYDVEGKIVSSEGQPIRDTTIVLYQRNQNPNIAVIDGCDRNKLPDLKFPEFFICHVKSDLHGEFLFPILPNGNYFLIPYFKGNNIFYEPEKIEFTVNHDSLTTEESFVIVGYSLSGKVLKDKQTVLPNVKIYLNNKYTGTTDSEGGYKLEKLKVGSYKIKAEAGDFVFDEFPVEIKTDSQKLPAILPSAFKVCGKITSDKPKQLSLNQVGSTRFVLSSDDSGKFCQFLTPGKYEIQVVVEKLDEEKGIQFFPLKHTFEVISDIITDISFSQLKANIAGSISCIRDEDCEGLIVIFQIGASRITVPVTGSKYTLSDMQPGIYQVSLDSNRLCWKNEQQTVNVNTANVVVPPFVHTGYSAEFLSSHDTRVTYVAPGKSKESTIQLTKGSTRVCLEAPGEYNFALIGCHTYDSPNIKYNTNADNNQIGINALSHQHKISIDNKANKDINVEIDIDGDKAQHSISGSTGKYEISILLKPGSIAKLTPVSDILFYIPNSIEIEGSNDCQDLGVKFQAVLGKVFKGKIVPAQAGVKITVTGDEELVTETDSNGVYKFPPLDNRKEYKIHAEKESYILTGPDSNGDFKAHKLAEVVVKVVDGADKSLLSSVLLSLSGGEGYRKNMQTAADGKIAFHSLSPGDYFLRPMMKEYQFEPNSMSISVKEGETVNVQLTGKRVAYSAFGKVTSLNGDPVENMIVVANGIENCTQYSEQTATDATGNFRIRGLKPFCSFEVSTLLNSENGVAIERTSPPKIAITAINNDQVDLKIVAFHPIRVLDVLVKVYAKNVEHYRSLKLKLYRETKDVPSLVFTGWVENSGKIEKNRNNGVIIHLPSLPVDQNTYSVHLQSVQNIKSTQEVKYFTANASFKFVDMEFVVKNTVSEQPIKQTSIWTVVFMFVILVCVYNIQVIVEALKVHFNFNLGILGTFIQTQSPAKTSTTYYDDIDQIVQDINNVRKHKHKKTS